MTTCTGHTRAIRIADSPIRLSAGSQVTFAPLGAAILRLHEPTDATRRRPLLAGLPGYRPTIVRLDWPDMTVPALTRDDWEWLAGRLAALKTPLHVHCAAGHGRTGTACAILATLWDMVPDGECPVTWLRARYCDKAVETAGQIAYVATITGRRVTAEPALSPPPPMPATRPVTPSQWSRLDRAMVGDAPDAAWTDVPGHPAPPPPPRTPSRYFPGTTLQRNADVPSSDRAWTGQRPGATPRPPVRARYPKIADADTDGK